VGRGWRVVASHVVAGSADAGHGRLPASRSRRP